MLQAGNSTELLLNLKSENLYVKLIQQLNKDMQMSNIDDVFEVAILPAELKRLLNELLSKLISNHYDSYLNFLYRVDVSELQLLNLKTVNLKESLEQVTFLILKREAQKVWLKHKFSK